MVVDEERTANTKRKHLCANIMFPDLEIGHLRFRALGHAICRAGMGQQFFASLAAMRAKCALVGGLMTPL